MNKYRIVQSRAVAGHLPGRALDLIHKVCLSPLRLDAADARALPDNGCDASQTLRPPGVGGDITTEADRRRVKTTLGSRVALIGGIDQSELERAGMAAETEADVETCFRDFGQGGGFICSASDHFFHALPENLCAMARAAASCTY